MTIFQKEIWRRNTLITERLLWDIVSLPDLNFSREARESPLFKRLCSILKIIESALDEVGISIYEVSIKYIRECLSRKGEEVDDSTAYRYLRKAISAGLLASETKTVVSYQRIMPSLPGAREIPPIHLLDTDGNDLPPFQIGSSPIFAERGESTFKIYKLSEKGRRLLSLSGGERDDTFSR